MNDSEKYQNLLTAYKKLSAAHEKLLKKRKAEFSKTAVFLILLFCMGCVTANYVLAFRNAENVNSEVTITLVTTILGTVIGYFLKSLGEKHSRNKHKIDE
jgi:uncharacterized membrane protein YqgA involved in biofilm formation